MFCKFITHACKRTHAHTHARTCTHAHVHTHTYTHIHTHTHMNIHTDTHAHRNRYRHRHTLISTLTLTLTHTHTHAHTRMRARTHTPHNPHTNTCNELSLVYILSDIVCSYPSIDSICNPGIHLFSSFCIASCKQRQPYLSGAPHTAAATRHTAAVCMIIEA